MNEIFSEIFGCYFSAAARILREAKKGISVSEMQKYASEHGFSETAYHMIPMLTEGEWVLLEERGRLYYSRLSGDLSRRPLTGLEKSWLKSICADPRIGLFLDEARLFELRRALEDVPPLFLPSDFYCCDRHSDGDGYSDPAYIANFRIILAACKSGLPLSIEYNSGKGGRSKIAYHPYKLSYSEFNDKFRLLCAKFDKRTGSLTKTFLNLSRIVSAEYSELPFRVSKERLRELFERPRENPPVAMEISKERNAPERCMLQFAAFEHRTEYDRKRGVYTCYIYYDMEDETELLIRILSFGPVVKVLGPESFLRQVKERVARQAELLASGAGEGQAP